MTGDALPDGWTLSTVESLSDTIEYGTSGKCSVEGDGIPVIRMGNIVDGGLDLADLKYLPQDHPDVPRLLLKAGDVLFNRTNSPELVGKTAVYDGTPPVCSFASYLIRVQPIGVLPKLLAHYINSPDGRQWARQCINQQVGQANISGGKLKALEVPVPPANEQERIVAKLDELTARSRHARESLDAIPPLLDKFRQSVLAAAFRGDLTAEWRGTHKERNPGSGPVQEETRNKVPEKLPLLPSSWRWATVGEVGIVQGGIQKQPSRRPTSNSFPFLRVANVHRGRLHLEDVHRIELFDGELEKLRLQQGDLLIVEGNGSPDEIGRMAIWDGSIPDCVHQNHLIRVRLRSGLLPELVEAFWASPLGRRKVFEKAQTTTGLYNLGTKKVAQLPVPVPPMDEQRLIVQRLGELLGPASRTDASTSTQLAFLDRLDRSILARAFRGELVPQDPDDEPASVLLERIRAERGATGNGQARGGARRGRRSAKQGTSDEPQAGSAEGRA